MARFFLLIAVVSWPTLGQAGSVFLNGVNIDGVTNQSFQNCTVEIDAYGNVHITAKGYAVQGDGRTSAPPAAPPAAGPPARRYWLVTEKAAPGMTQYDIDLFINSKWVRKFRSAEEHKVMEITKYLHTGANKIQFVAKKNVGASRRSASPQHYFRIIIGEGNTGGRNVMISKKAIDYKRTALETKDYSDQFTLVVQ